MAISLRAWKTVTLILGGLFLLGAGLLGGYLVARQEPPPPVGTIPQLLAQAHAYLDREEMRKATQLYQHVLSQDPANVEAITHLGNIAYSEGHLDRALELYDRALSLDPRYAHALYDKGVALRFGKSDYAGAISIWRRFLEVIPPGEDTRRVQGWIKETQRLLDQGAVPRQGLAPARRSLPTTLSPGRFTGKTARMYQIAREIPEILDRLPCYCGCDKSSGHAGLLACYIDSHAAT